ncbi:MAG: hypothetical protein J6Y15_09025 [Bacteroidaceae bacterium]|nr:hypothetical protein [Bacteroidaceae bacterium]
MKTEEYKNYRLNSMEEPTDEMLHTLMEGIAEAARESTRRAEAEKRKMFDDIARTIRERRAQRNVVS